MRGRRVPLSLPRRLVIDLMKFSLPVPRVTVQRRMNLATLVEARLAAEARPSWTALFVKAYALLAQETPELRRAYVKLPWPQIYEYAESVASIAHEREYEGERAVLLSRVKAPDRWPLTDLDALIRATRAKPVLEVSEFRRALKLARVPAPVRRFAMWLGLNLGRQRPNYFGTFQVSVYSGLGAESFNPLTPLTTLLNYGPIDDDGRVDVRIIYDHRVMDGATVARALRRLEEILTENMVAELAKPPRQARAG